MFRLVALFTLLSAAQISHGHHSSAGIYDADRIVEVEGVVTSVRWRNPHASYTVAVAGANGETVEWYVETGSVSTLRLRGVGEELIQVGDRVRLAGDSSLRGRPEMFARNVLLANGQEVLLRAISTPRWSEGLSGDLFEPAFDEARAEEARRTANGMFRVWSTVLGDPDSFPLYGDGVSPLTASARELKAEWDPRASPYIGCHPKGMPYIMVTPYPIEFIRQGDDILLRFEEHDSERLIYMNAPRSSLPESYSLFGYSMGQWEGGTLVVETERINAPYFYGDGTPQSRMIRLVEHFTLSETEDRLDYRLFVNDPSTFEKRLEFTRYWAWKPDIRVERYNCQE